MFDFVLAAPLLSGAVPVTLILASAVVLVVLAIRRPARRSIPRALVSALVGAAIGALVTWLTGDVFATFDVGYTPWTKIWTSLGFAGIAVAATSFRRSTVRRKVLAGFSIMLFVVTMGVGINSDVQVFPTLGSIFDANGITALHIPTAVPTAAAGPTIATWVAPADMPARGSVGTVMIPATTSLFPARAAVVYLPPAALVAHPPRLPVLEMLSGQPGQPSDLVTAGQLPTIFDAYASAHHGLGPIVVVPDQLGAPDRNPMCVDSPLGNSATYIATDVPNWIRSHLGVLPGRDAWAIGGFSQGGTCAIQLGAAHTDLYGSILDIAGQEAPLRGTVAATIADGFGGSAAKYNAASAAALLRAGAPFRSTVGIFAVGQDDARYGPGAARVVDEARKAGISTTSLIAPGSGHDWRTVKYALEHALPVLYSRWDLK